MSTLSWILRILVAGILIQTLYFKFTAAPESVYIFTQLGLEPWGRLLSGLAELLVSILILIPRTTWLGALVGLGVISGALFSHLAVLGIEVQEDGGLLFALAVIVFLACLGLLILQKNAILEKIRTRRFF